MRLGVFPAAASTPTGVFNQRFEALFPCEVCLPPQLFLLVYLHMNVGPPSLQSATLSGPPAIALSRVFSTPAAGPRLCPSYSLDECFFFNSFVVRLPYSSIFCQFWWVLFLNLLSFFWLCRRHSVSAYASILAGGQASSCWFSL